MLFVKNKKLSLDICDTCHGDGYIHFHPCQNCKRLHVGYFFNNLFVYFGQSITFYNIKQKQARQILDIVRIIGSLVFSFSFFALFLFEVYKVNKSFDNIFTLQFWSNDITGARLFFWFSTVSFAYLFYRLIANNVPKEEIDYNFLDKKTLQDSLFANNWEEIKKISHKHKFDISQFLTANAKTVLEKSYLLARNYKHSEITSLHVFYTLLDTSEIIGIFVRLNISIRSVKAHINSLLQSLPKNNKESETKLGEEFWQIIFNSFEITYEIKDSQIRTTEILLATVRESEILQEMLYDLEVENQKLNNVVEWVRMKEYLYDEYKKFRKAASGVSKYGMDKAMTAVATPYLNNYSKDLTIYAKYGHLSQCVARDKEIEEIFNIVEAGRDNVILVGEHGVGKMSIIEGIVQKMISGKAPKKLLDKRFVQISTSSLLAGTTVSGAQERLIRIMNEVSRAKNIILFINNLSDLTGSAATQGESLDVSETLAEYLSGGNITMFATALPEGYNRHIVNSEIGTVFTKVSVKEMNQEQSIRVLQSKAGEVEYHNKIFFSYDAIEKCVVLADKFFFDQNMPAGAISLLSEVGSFARSKRGDNILVSAEEVGEVVANKTGVPVSSITENESSKLMRLEQEMHKRVVGQDIAVELVANALRRARAEMRSQKRPIANFLFLGPTGVGKTELAKTIAEVYFGGEERMIRLDMSEFQDTSSIYRLIGQPGQQGTGLLTEAVRQNPFSLLLLDELEKADRNVLNLFLQVFDDGRLTDSVGRVIDFTNTIIIATSNAGTSYVQAQMKMGVDLDRIKENLLHGELMQYYRPEFLNRFDGIVLFKALNREEIKVIAAYMLKRVAKDLENRGVELVVTDESLEALVDVGFDPDFGARPMRRAIQDRIENRLAEFILQGKLQRRDKIILGEALQIHIERN
ncbi:MAG: AAA family ATPase [Candidatus Magasanikbacteria bacterium]